MAATVSPHEQLDATMTDTYPSKSEKTSAPDDISMKCALVTKFTDQYGKVDDVIEFTAISKTKPVLNPKQKQLLVKVLACSISAGDTIVLSGDILFIRPELPFIPGMEVCGIVEKTTDGVLNFKVGDMVVANNGMLPVGGMAEYMVVDATLALPKPPSVSILQGACCMSAITSYSAVTYVKKGYRVLILGGSGGVGSSAIQLAKNAGANFVATTSTQREMCISLGADEVIDYREKNWWENNEFRKDKFDVIIDTVGGGNFYDRATHVLKTGSEGGRFVGVTGDEPRPDCTTYFKIMKFFVKLASRPLWTWLNKRSYPIYIALLPTDEMEGLKKVLAMMEEGKLKIVLDPSSPHEFSENGVKEAFRIQGNGHAHGKVVVQVSQQSQKD